MTHAITIDAFGGPDQMHLAEVPTPNPGPDQVRIAVRAAGINPLDYKIRNGWLADAFPVTFPFVLGSDVAGVIDAIGTNVTDHAVGDEVIASVRGGYATHALADRVDTKPPAMTWTDAAAYPVVAEAAWRCLHQLDLTAGQTVLINGAGGSVGRCATQFATYMELEVIAVAGTADLEDLARLGATPVTYGDGLIESIASVAPDGVDAALDCAGRGTLPDLITITGNADRVLTIADPQAHDLGVRFSGAAPRDRMPEGITEALRLHADGRMDIPVTTTWPLAEAATALRSIETGETHGKAVLTVG